MDDVSVYLCSSEYGGVGIYVYLYDERSMADHGGLFCIYRITHDCQCISCGGTMWAFEEEKRDCIYGCGNDWNWWWFVLEKWMVQQSSRQKAVCAGSHVWYELFYEYGEDIGENIYGGNKCRGHRMCCMDCSDFSWICDHRGDSRNEKWYYGYTCSFLWLSD